MDLLKPPSPFTGIAFRQAKYAVLAAFIIGVLLSVLQIYLDFYNQSKNFDRDIKQVIETAKASAVRAAFVLDAHAAEDVVEGLFQFAAVVKVRILTDTGELLVQRSKQKRSYQFAWLTRILFGQEWRYPVPLTLPDDQERIIGRMVVFADVNMMAEGWLERSVTILASGIIRNLILAALLTILFFYFLSKPLLEIIHAIAKVEPGSLDVQRIQVPKGHEEDELNTLVIYINKLLASANQFLQGLVLAKENLKDKVATRTFELKQNQQRLEVAQRISQTGHWIWEVNRKQLLMSEEARHILCEEGAKTSPITTYKALVERIHPDDRSGVERAMEKALSDAVTHDVTYRILLETGVEKFIHEIAEIERNPDGSPKRIVGTIQDITTYRRAEDKAARFGRMIEESSNEIWLFDASSLHFVLLSDGARENLGYEINELQRLTPVDIEQDCTLAVFEERLAPLRKGETDSLVYETRYQRKDGSNYYAEVRLQLSQREIPPIFVASVWDITERIKAENYRRTNETRLSMLLELNRDAAKLDEKELCSRALDIAVAITDSKIGYLHMVNADQETIQLVTWNAVALKLCKAVHATHYPISQAGIWADSFRQKRTVIHNDYPNESSRKGYPENHFPVLRHMSSPVMMETRVYMILGVGNKEGSYTDEDAVQLELVADEVHKFIMRWRAEEALKVARSAAETASRAKSEFLANMSHEIRTPLNVMLGISDEVIESDLSEEQRNQLSMVHNAGQHLLNLINDILDLSKIETGSMILDSAPFQIDALFSSVNNMMQSRAKEKELAYILDFPADFPACVHGDEGRLRQILINLLGNAIKFTDQGHIIFKVVYIVQGSLFQISVTDTGVGIAPEYLEHIFDKFTQADASISRRYGG
ncbi:sensor histidine kinase, partial [Magnetococcales bacterium HHB-1]